MISKINFNFNLKQINTKQQKQDFSSFQSPQTNTLTDTFTPSSNKINFNGVSKYKYIKWNNLVADDTSLQQYLKDISKYEPLKDSQTRRQLFLEFIQAKNLKEDALQKLLEANIKTVIKGSKTRKNMLSDIQKGGFYRMFAFDDLIRANAKVLSQDSKKQMELFDQMLNAGNFRNVVLPELVENNPNLVSKNNDEVKQIIGQIQKADKVIERMRPKLIEGNLRLVILTAMKFINYTDIPVKDIIQAGNIGLINAIDTYKMYSDSEFSSYACKLITYSIINELANSSNIIRIPSNVLQNIKQMEKTEKSFTEKYSRNPSVDELACESGIKPGYIQFLKRIKDMNGEFENIEKISYNSKWTNSSNDTRKNYSLTNDELLLVRDVLPENIQNSIYEILNQDDLSDAVEKILASLPLRQRDIIRKRFGIDDGTIKSLSEVAAGYNLTSTRIGQLESKALKKLRHPELMKQMREFYNN